MKPKQPIVCGLLVLVIGCSGGDGSQSNQGQLAGDGAAANGRAQPSTSGKPWDPSLGTATVRGVVRFTGTPPRRRPIDMGAKVECNKLHKSPVLDESVIVNSDGTLKNVFVWVKRGLRGWQFPAPSEPAVLNQQGCMFRPHVQGVRVGQPITIRNSDPFGHNVHALAQLNSPFNFSQPTQGQEEPRTFTYREVMVRLKCDIHGWMSSYIGVVPHPYFTVTGDDGTFELAGLPPGQYTIEAWHEELGTKTEKLTVADHETKDIEFSF